MTRRRTLLILILLILIGLLSAIAGTLAGLIKLPELVSTNPLVALVLVCVTLGILGWLLWRIQSHPETQEMPHSLARQNRQRMLAAVRAIWITGVLEHSLHDAVLIALGLREQPAAVANPWRLAVQEIGHAPRDLPAGTPIIKAFDDAGGKLLILGAPGAGKTTLLLELARDLLSRAEQDEQQPIPVIFSLSSWASGQSKLADWLVEELKVKYQVPGKVGRAWIENNQLLLLLDGLDEVPQGQREACVEAINTYQQREEHGLTPLVLSSREVDYLDLARLVLLHTAVTVQPLTSVQIDAYLSSVGRQLNAVRAALLDDVDLQALANSPLMLSILSLAYQGQTAEDLLETPPAARQRHLFGVYVQRMLDHRKAALQYAPEQTKRWLAWLARKMRDYGFTELYIERLQPGLLPKGKSRWFYDCTVGTLPLILIGGLLFGLPVWLLFASYIGHGTSDQSTLGVLISLACSFGGGAFLMEGDSKGGVYGPNIWPTEVAGWSWRILLRNLTNFNEVGPLIFSFIFSLFGSLGLAILILVRALFGWSLLNNFIPDPQVGMVSLTVIWVFIGLLAGWSSDVLDEHTIARPNEGIWRSARNSLLLGGICGSIVGGVSLWLTGGEGWASALALGVDYGVFFGLWRGGVACIRHFALRFLLWRTGCIPWNYVEFLNYSTDHILLRRVGGGYSFIHRLLLDYFAELDTVTNSAPNE